MFYVYKITNLINGKFYVGETKDPKQRFLDHRKIARGGKAKYPGKFHIIHAAITKYSIDNFKFEIIHTVSTKQESLDLEVIEIKNARDNNIEIYNIGNGGRSNSGISGWKHTEESKKKMSESRKGKTFSDEHKKALSEAQSGERHSQFGKHQTIEWKENKGKLKSDDVKQIKLLINSGVKNRIIAKQFSVSEATISLIKHEKIWPEIKVS